MALMSFSPQVPQEIVKLVWNEEVQRLGGGEDYKNIKHTYTNKQTNITWTAFLLVQHYYGRTGKCDKNSIQITFTPVLWIFQCWSKILFFTYLHTTWCRVLLEKLTGLQLVKKFAVFHGTRRFITALTNVRHLSLSWASPIQFIYPHPTS